jgi:hypothetical protein
MSATARAFLFLLVLFAQGIWAAPRQLDDYHWTGVERIVAIGDVHGDFDSYLTVLRAAGVVDARGRWIAGQTHVVQTGDIPDRGPDTRRIITHLAGLAKQAKKHGGRIHNLMGNHEAMNVYGDLRYADDGEYLAFAGDRAEVRRDRYFATLMKELERRDPTRHASLPPDFREQWDRQHPLGWVEHRNAWDPRWNPNGEMYRWTMQARIAIQLNQLIFLHAGLSGDYCGNSLASLTEMAHAVLRRADPQDQGILTDERGPLWYRGMAGVEPQTRVETVDAILRHHDARHIVIGHTPTQGVIWPRLDRRIIQIDTGMGAAYGKHLGWLEVTGDKLFAGYPNGRIALPENDAARLDYLDAVIALQPDNSALQARRATLQAAADNSSGPYVDAERAPMPDSTVICGTSR